MNDIILYSVLSLSFIGIIDATILYFIAQKFKVREDPRIDLVEDVLPAANCGGCGYAGCRNFAENISKTDSPENFYCPPGGDEIMNKVAKILGKEINSKYPKIAVLRCNGCTEHRPNTNTYVGINSCTFIDLLYGGETNCHYGCLSAGECVEACHFDAMYMDDTTGLPVVIEDNCVGCEACVKVCPKNLFEMRKKGPKSRRIFVSCMNKDKGAVARRACKVACIGCSLCLKECPFDAIKVENFLAYIDDVKCRLCRKCVPVCPTNAIHELNFPIRKKSKRNCKCKVRLSLYCLLYAKKL